MFAGFENNNNKKSSIEGIVSQFEDVQLV